MFQIVLMKAKKFNEADFAKYHPGGKIGKRLLTKVKDVMKTDKLPILDKNMDLSDIIYNISNSGYGIGFLLQNKNIIGVITDGDIQKAITQPPQTTRARLRGEFIKHARERNRDYTVDWVHLKLNDHPQQRSVLCKDPFKYVDERVEKLIETL